MSGSQEGFAAVDALVALAILGGTFAVGVSALVSARNVAAASAEMAAADAVLRLVTDRQPGAIGAEGGRLGEFLWAARTVMASAVPSGPAICQRTVAVTSQRTGRRYRLATYVFCRPPDPRS